MPGGTFVSIPTLTDDGDIPAVPAAKGVKRVFSTMSDVGCAAMPETIAGLLVAGQVTPAPLREFALKDAAEAQRRIQGGHTHGKLVPKVQDT